MSDVRIVLCMIVKNEAAVVRRCLDAALPYVDGYVVCDTGSDDATVDIVHETAAVFGVPGRIARHVWQNFGVNRTLSAEEARRWASEQGFVLERTYLLLLDADMVLRVGPDFDKAALHATSYDVAQEDGSLRYFNTRLACLSHVWRAVGVTHEYWEPIGAGASTERLESAWIEDFGDGGSKSRKFERDIELLTQGLRDEPDNVRYHFYLARSLHDLGRTNEAAAEYRGRWELGGWDEECWYARYQEGVCLLELGESERGAGVLLEAFESRPTRGEPLHALARHYRDRGKNHLAFLLARRGVELAYPSNDVLFVSKSVHEWQLWEEVMINAYYAGERYRDFGFAACERLAAQRGHDDAFYEYVACNESFYVPCIESARRGIFSVSNALRTAAGTQYACMNPTLVGWRGGFHVNVRMVNYRQERGRMYVSSDCDQIIRTRNATLAWDASTGRALSERESAHRLPRDWPTNTLVVGLEDMRWTVHEDRVWFTSTTCQVPGAGGSPRVVLGRMSDALDAVEHLVSLDYAGATDIEKNWVPWSLDGMLCLVYSYDPLVVLRVDPGSGKTTTLGNWQPPFHARRYRGGTAPVPIPGCEGRFLTLVHEVTHHPTENVYTHRFLELDRRLEAVRRSRPFVFDHAGIEYATGLASVDDSTLLVTYGFEDREARWIELGWSSILESLERAE